MIVEFKFRVFYSETNGYTVAKYKNIETGKKVNCVGFFLPTDKSKKYEFETESYNDSRYGLTEKVLCFKDYVDENSTNPSEILSTLIKGVGKKTAEKIVKELGKDCLSILKSNPDAIEKTSVNDKVKMSVSSFFREQSLLFEVTKYFSKWNISARTAAKITYYFDSEIWSVLKETPYDLCNIKELTFPIIDSVAKENGVRDDNYERLLAAALYVLKEDWTTGNTCMELDSFVYSMLNVLNSPSLNNVKLQAPIIKMIKDKSIRYRKKVINGEKKEYIYHPWAYDAELTVFNNIFALSKGKKKNVSNIDDLISKFSKNIILGKEQIEAIKLGVTSPVFVITGGPGTGKTTILKIIADINKYLNNGKDNNVFLSPTGRAARRITESTGYAASTIHRKLGLGIISEDNILSDLLREKICNSKVIVDESSMVDLWIMNSLVKSLDNSSIGFIGDPDQLPSVGCGSILRDLIEGNVVPVVKLKTIYRQSNDAINICDNAYKINTGNSELTEGDDFKFIASDDSSKIEEIMVNLFLQETKQYGIHNVKCLSPYKKEISGTYSLNSKIQDIINPLNGRKELPIYNNMTLRVNDIVMQLKNTSTIANGDIGEVTFISNKEVEVNFGDFVEIYSYERAKEELTLAYATTIHKSQGSEYDSVIICCNNAHKNMLKRNLIYTGITRGKKKVTIVGHENALNYSIANNTIDTRNSFLKDMFLCEAKNQEKEKPISQILLPTLKTGGFCYV